MKKSFSLLVFIVFSIILVSVEHKVMANICEDGLGDCVQCNERCQAKHGPTGEGHCTGPFNLCTCLYQCGPAPPAPPAPPRRKCQGGAGLCNTSCGNSCCNQSCAQKYPGGAGFCDSLGHTLLCKCEYPC